MKLQGIKTILHIQQKEHFEKKIKTDIQDFCKCDFRRKFHGSMHKMVSIRYSIESLHLVLESEIYSKAYT